MPDQSAITPAVETYTPQRKAELLLSNAVDNEDYAQAVEAVRQMGIDQATIPHYKPYPFRG